MQPYSTIVHGSPYDRGSADSYYGRPREPHWWPEGTGHGRKRDMSEMTADQITEYLAGYEDNERNGDKKDWS